MGSRQRRGLTVDGGVVVDSPGVVAREWHCTIAYIPHTIPGCDFRSSWYGFLEFLVSSLTANVAK